MKELYLVKHYYSVDGGYGDAVYTNEAVAIFENESDAEDFCMTYGDRHVYDTPYDDLCCGELDFIPIPVFTHEDYESTKWKWVESRYRGVSATLYTDSEAHNLLLDDLKRLDNRAKTQTGWKSEWGENALRAISDIYSIDIDEVKKLYKEVSNE